MKFLLKDKETTLKYSANLFVTFKYKCPIQINNKFLEILKYFCSYAILLSMQT